MRHHSQYGRSYSSGGSQLGTLNLTARGGGQGPKSGPLSSRNGMCELQAAEMVQVTLVICR